MKVWVTKYALTSGILEMEANQSGDLIYVKGGLVGDAYYYGQYFHKGEWFKTREDANEKAEQMRQRKLCSLQKQMTKLQKMEFV